ncbi:MAG: RDD family protein, partial [Chthoniobacterales bacterium]
MDWYYAEKNERRGPITEGEFNELIRTGKIDAETQVWRAGWADWAPLGEAGAQLGAEGNGAARCAECIQTFPTSEMVQYEGAWVCPTCKPVFFQKVKEGIEPTREMNYAGFWIRFVAKFVDGLIVGVPGYAVRFGIVALLPNPESIVTVTLISWLISLSMNITYYTWLHGKYGATLGKMACGLRLVQANGGKVSYGTAIGRFFAEIVSAIVLY